MKVFVGMSEVAGMITFVSNAFSQCGHSVTTCIDNYATTFYDYEYDIILNDRRPEKLSSNRVLNKIHQKIRQSAELNRREKVYRKHRDEHDLYIFIWNGFHIDDTEDFKYLKSKGKKIISLFVGSDVRHISAFTQEYNLDTRTWENWFHTTDLNQQLFRLRKAELFSDLLYSVPDQAGLAIRPYNKIYIPFDTKPFTFNIPGRTVPRVVHIPSRTGIKGTSFIIEVVEELKAEGLAFEFEAITQVPNSEVINKLTDADILVDELFLHGPGTLSLEAISCGCAVATKTMKGEIFDSALCNVDFANLKEKLRKLILDVDFRKSVAVKSYETVRYINDPVRIVKDFLDKTVNNDSHTVTNDYYPRFFSEQYMVPEGKKINRRNKLLTTEVIKEHGLASGLNVARMKDQNLI